MEPFTLRGRRPGTGRDVARRRVDRGVWQRLAPGFYLPHTQAPTDLELARATLAWAGPRALLTGRLAARALRMRWIPDGGEVRVLVPTEVRRDPQKHFVVRRTARFAELEPWSWFGLPVAPPGRIVLDTALTGTSLRQVRGIVLGAIEDRWVTAEQLRGLLATEPRNGTKLLRRALLDSDDGAASPPEAELVDALRRAGQPFLVNPELWLNDRLLGIPDGWFVGLGCGWEMDSRERHAGDDDFDRTLARHDAFAAHGLVLAHLTPARLRRDPSAAVGAVLAVPAARKRLPAELREPAGLRVVPRGPVLGCRGSAPQPR